MGEMQAREGRAREIGRQKPFSPCPPPTIPRNTEGSRDVCLGEHVQIQGLYQGLLGDQES